MTYKKYEQPNRMSLKEFRENYKEKWNGLILKEICEKCKSENLIIINWTNEEKYPLSKCLDCGHEMTHFHYCWICGEEGEDELVCHKCSEKYTLEETRKMIKRGKKGWEKQVL